MLNRGSSGDARRRGTTERVGGRMAERAGWGGVQAQGAVTALARRGEVAAGVVAVVVLATMCAH